MITTLQMLVRASNLVRKGWCQNFCATDREGNVVATDSPRAAKWCAFGAIRAVRRHEMKFCVTEAEQDQLAISEDEALTALGGFSEIVNYSEALGRTQAEVVARFDAAIREMSKCL